MEKIEKIFSVLLKILNQKPHLRAYIKKERQERRIKTPQKAAG
jgi:hypothetical protein